MAEHATSRQVQALLLGRLFSFARRIVTQALVALGVIDCDRSASYRLFNEPRIGYDALSGCLRPGPSHAGNGKRRSTQSEG